MPKPKTCLGQTESFEQNQSDAFEGVQLQGENLQELEDSKNSMKCFIEELNELKNTHILQWILKYLGKFRTGQPNAETVFLLIERRVEKMIKNRRIKKNWGSQDSRILIWTVSKFCELYKIYRLDDMTNLNWEFISQLIPGAQPRDCLFKWLTFKKTKLSDSPWTQEESQILRKLVQKYGEQEWKQISLVLYELNKNKKKKFRNPKQCRQHWLSFLNPKKKTGLWQKQEDIKLLSSVLEKKGEKKWSEIRKNFAGRTQNAMKNRYNLLLEKQKKLTESDVEVLIVYEALKDLGAKNLRKYKNLIQNINGFQNTEQMINDELSRMILSNLEDEQSQFIKEYSLEMDMVKNEEEQSVVRSPTTSISISPQVKVIDSNFESIIQFVVNCGHIGQLIPAIVYDNMRIQILKLEQI